MNQIVLHKSGTDPDFTATKRFEIDVENLIGRIRQSVICCNEQSKFQIGDISDPAQCADTVCMMS